jgi:hypothetical protein
LLHGHGAAVYSDSQPEFRAPFPFDPKPKTLDTIIGDSYYPENSVELPRHSEFSAKDATREALYATQQSGISGDKTTCNLFLGSCEAGGAVDSIASEWKTWEALGLDSAIGASAANESSFDNSQLPGDVPGENLLGTYYAFKKNPPRHLDLDGDNVIDLGEVKRSVPALNSVHFSGYVLGTARANGTEDPQTTGVDSRPVLKIPNTDIPIVSEKYENRQQNLSFAGKDDTPLFKFDPLPKNKLPARNDAPPSPPQESKR